MGRNARVIEGRNAEILPTERRISVRVGTSPNSNGIYDYHFMSQFSDNTWGEKHGIYDRATDGRSVQHKQGENPDNILWDSSYGAGDGFYDSKIVYIAITN